MDVHADIMACLHALRHDVNELPDQRACACLTNFVDVCGWLYTAEVEDEYHVQEIGEFCRRRILETHKKSVRLLVKLLGDAGKHQKQRDVDTIALKMKELIDVGEELDGIIGRAPSSVSCSLTLDQLVLANFDDDSPIHIEPRLIDNYLKASQSMVIRSDLFGCHLVDKSLVGRRVVSAYDQLHNSSTSYKDIDNTHTSIQNETTQSPGDEFYTENETCDMIDTAQELSAGDLATTLSENTHVEDNSVSSVHNDLSLVGDYCKAVSSIGDHYCKEEVATVDETLLAKSSEPEVNKILTSLEQLKNVCTQLERVENEAWSTNKILSHRLEVLKQEAGSHPAIEVYTARNCHSPLAAKARRAEYAQYACAMERVLKKMKKAAGTLRTSRNKDLTTIDTHMPSLKTLSNALADLHTNLQDASADCDQQQTPAVTPTEQALDEPKVKTDRGTPRDVSPSRNNYKAAGTENNNCDKRIIEKIACISASIGRARRSIDGNAGNVDAILRDEGTLHTTVADIPNETDPEKSRPATKHFVLPDVVDPSTAGTSSCTLPDINAKQKPTLGEELVAIDTLKFLPLGDKECRDHLLSGTLLLATAVEDLSLAVKNKSMSLEAHVLLDSALCRPFPETSIYRLELERQLKSLEESCKREPSKLPPTSKDTKKYHSRSRSPTKEKERSPSCLPRFTYRQQPSTHQDKQEASRERKPQNLVKDDTDRMVTKPRKRPPGHVKRKQKRSISVEGKLMPLSPPRKT